MKRFLGKCLVGLSVVALVAVAVQPALAQRGRGMGRMRAYPMARLATLSEVQADLKLTDEQKTKVTAIADGLQSDLRGLFTGGGPPDMDQLEKLNQEASAKVDAALDPAQAKRLHEITVQVNGPSSLNDPSVRKQLNFSDDQTKKFEEARDANRQAMQELFDLPREERGAKLEEFRKAADDRLLGVLTPEQKSEFEALQGAPLKIDLSPLQPRFGGGGGGGRNN